MYISRRVGARKARRSKTCGKVRRMPSPTPTAPKKVKISIWLSKLSTLSTSPRACADSRKPLSPSARA